MCHSNDERLKTMERTSIKKLDIAQLKELIAKCSKLQGSCAGVTCDNCVCSRDQYTETYDKVMPCREVVDYIQIRLTELEQGAKPDNPYPDTYDTIQITPETTSLKYMIETGYVHVLAEVFADREGRDRVCKNSECASCKLHQRNYSKDIEDYHDCRPPMKDIIVLSKALKSGAFDNSSKAAEDTCLNCQYLVKNDYLFCKAWGNYTTEEMYCKYHKPIDK